MYKITTATTQPLHSVEATRILEQDAQRDLPAHTLMQRAGLAVARLTRALAPHAQCIWVACGPGNNGGDGLEAAAHLHAWATTQGSRVVVTWTGPNDAGKPTEDVLAAHAKAVNAGVVITTQVPDDFDFCIDALLGIGSRLGSGRPTSALITQWLCLMHGSHAPCLAIDVPTGLDADTGQNIYPSAPVLIADSAIKPLAAARFTLSLLTLKPGLFTADGRDQAGEVWLDDLGVPSNDQVPTAYLLGTDRVSPSAREQASHASHKGTFGDVAILGGESSPTGHMTGAALLAARAALHSGAGRVIVCLLSNTPATPQVDPQQPELMFRSVHALDFTHQTTVCGCGGGRAVNAVLPTVLSLAQTLVLDADALNSIAAEPSLAAALKARAAPDVPCDKHEPKLPGKQTILTPHPLEAARLLGITVHEVQADRRVAAQALADLFGVVVVLKGSGTLIAAPNTTPCINASGNALLSTAGTGDVLAGMVGARLAGGLSAWDAACSAVFAHGHLADEWRIHKPGQLLTASRLVSATP